MKYSRVEYEKKSICNNILFSLKKLFIMSKINTKLTKLIKYYSLINHNLIFNNIAINRYQKNQPKVNEESLRFEEVKIKNN